ncbi:CBS domain-containing protein, partial [Methanothermococcus sp. SCGC AD-155-E23]|nr:CBS domain-containing protein [Methanothermococcus sp. SCGC AD-155-E23]
SEDKTLKDVIPGLETSDRVYVLDKNRRLKGIISKTDVLRILKILEFRKDS